MRRAATFVIFKAAKSFQGVHYSERKNKQGKSALLEAFNFGHLGEREDVGRADYIQYLERWSATNGRTRNKQFHAVISTEGKTLSHAALAAYAKEIMKQLGYGDCPTLLYGHHDTDNNHVHIVTSRIDRHGKKIDDANEGRRAVRALDQLLGIERSSALDKCYTHSLEYRFSTTAQWRLILEKQGVQVTEGKAKYRLYKQGETRYVEKRDIYSRLATSQKDQGQLRDLLLRLKTQFSPALYQPVDFYPSRIPQFSETLTSALAQHLRETHNIELVFHVAESRTQPYGYTLIDHQSKMILKGSEVLSLQGLLHLSEPQHHQQEEMSSGASAMDPLNTLVTDIISGVGEVGKPDVEGKEHDRRRKRRRRL